MSDWTQRIAAILGKESVGQKNNESSNLKPIALQRLSLFGRQSNPPPKKPPAVAFNQDMSSSIQYNSNNQAASIPLEKEQGVAKVPKSDNLDADNVSALKKLRDMPGGMVGMNVDSRIAAVKNMLGEKEIFKTLQMLRWPKGIVCPKCKSTNIVRRDPPADAPDRRHHYVCLSCKGEGRASDFDDFTGLPVGSLHGLRQWIFCWYLIGFCSISKISKVLGLSVADISQIISIGSQITDLAEGSSVKDRMASKEHQGKKRQKSFFDNRKDVVERQEHDTRSESINIFKPGPKSKK